MYINEPADPSKLTITGPMKIVVYASLVGTLLLGIYPKPFIEWIVTTTMLFSNLVGPTASTSGLI
jgi:NADH-quinone oxidoreductase subunit N